MTEPLKLKPCPLCGGEAQISTYGSQVCCAALGCDANCMWFPVSLWQALPRPSTEAGACEGEPSRPAPYVDTCNKCGLLYPGPGANMGERCCCPAPPDECERCEGLPQWFKEMTPRDVAQLRDELHCARKALDARPAPPAEVWVPNSPIAIYATEPEPGPGLLQWVCVPVLGAGTDPTVQEIADGLDATPAEAIQYAVDSVGSKPLAAVEFLDANGWPREAEILRESDHDCKEGGPSMGELIGAVEAGAMAFEFLGERMNYADGAAGEARANLDKLAEWGERIRAVIPEPRRAQLMARVYPMLKLDASDDLPDSDER